MLALILEDPRRHGGQMASVLEYISDAGHGPMRWFVTCEHPGLLCLVRLGDHPSALPAPCV
eukprot:scaffold19363_cov103-Isochrysis_galbana.AAC.1